MATILGISAHYHESAACLLRDGEIVAAAQEERFSRVKHDHRFPGHAARACLLEAGIGVEALDCVAFYDKPFLKFDRILETHLAVAPRGLPAFVQAIPAWLGEKLWVPDLIADALGYARRGEPDRGRAIPEYQRVLQALPEGRLRLAEAFARLGRVDEAAAQYRELLRFRPRDARARERLAELERRQRRTTP